MESKCSVLSFIVSNQKGNTYNSLLLENICLTITMDLYWKGIKKEFQQNNKSPIVTSSSLQLQKIRAFKVPN